MFEERERSMMMTGTTRSKLHLGAAMTALLLGACGGVEEGELEEFDETEDAICSTPDIARELMITDLRVVEDSTRTSWTGGTANAADGAWHFGRLMANMAGPNDPAVFVRSWLASWETSRTINGFSVPARTAIRQIVSDWPKLADGRLDLRKAPFRLLAIVNRVDLRKLSAGKAGEGRFVFAPVRKDGSVFTGFTVILEYNLLGSTQSELLKWANDWHNLGTLAMGSDQYKAALQKITDRFAGKGAAPMRVNGSAISQVRTNEVDLAFPWELREFRLNATSGRLGEVTVQQTPANQFNGTSKLARFINANESAILQNRHVVPLQFESAPFRAASIFNNIDFWNAPGINNANARHKLSLNTCNGCHGAETNTGFLHVAPRAKGVVSQLSGFLRGETVNDPVTGTARTFNDLRRRQNDLKTLVCSTTLSSDTLEGQATERVH
jgi:hypothetical protein